LINNNPNLNLKYLATLTDSSPAAISKRIWKNNRHGVKVNYKNKSGKKFTDELLVDLVYENPKFNQEELAKLVEFY
jgi:hypothetical protein